MKPRLFAISAFFCMKIEVFSNYHATLIAIAYLLRSNLVKSCPKNAGDPLLDSFIAWLALYLTARKFCEVV